MRAVLVAALLLAAPARALWWLGPTSQSRWRDRPITVDGGAEDWRAQEADDAGALSFAFANDDQDLYVMIRPHTKAARAQIGGTYGQEFTVWIDPKAGREHRLVVTVRAPSGPSGERVVEAPALAVAGSTASVEAQAAMGLASERGVFEARIPLRFLGTPRPERVTVGIETSKPTKIPERAGVWERGDKKGKGEARPQVPGFIDEDYLPIRLLIRVTLSAGFEADKR
ncbi:MAG: hypothetical protein NTX64_05140 [Elusimicrobia bacterium]|nr:hypothetical protein [Elusimicrobiota bacterium]